MTAFTLFCGEMMDISHSIETCSEYKQRIFIVNVVYDKHTVMIWVLYNIKIVWTLWGKEKPASN